MDINTHGRKINLDSLIKAANDTVDWPYNTGRTDIQYDTDTGEVWCADYMGSPIESWGVYDDSVLIVARTTQQRSAQWIADRIHEALGE